MNLNLIAKVLTICLGLLEVVSSNPQLYKASDGQDYRIEFEPKFNHLQAWHECSRRGYQLVEIDSDEKNSVIIDILKKDGNINFFGLWFSGINDDINKRTTVWSATGRQLKYTCAHISSESSDYKWNDVACDDKMGFICEDNHLTTQRKKYLKYLSNLLKIITSSISDVHAQAHTQQLSEIDNKIQNVKKWRALIQLLETTTQMAITNILDEQPKTVEQLKNGICNDFCLGFIQ